MPSSPPAAATLAEAKRQAAVDHMLAAARRLVLQQGLDVTMDQLAEAVGVSRRTLFRHFETREKLVSAAFEAGMTGYLRQLPTLVDHPGDPRGWLRATCTAAHRMNATIGPGFFELASRPDLPPELAAAEQRRRHDFRSAAGDVTRTLWQALGPGGSPPPALTTTVTAHLSPHFTAALVVDADRDWRAAAELAYAAILAAVQSMAVD